MSETENLPAGILVAADAVIQLNPIGEADLRDACLGVLGLKVSAKQAAELLTFPRDLMINALRRGRPIADSLRRLNKHTLGSTLSAAVREESPRLEELHGYGDAKTWGLQLADDLKLWERGQLRWSEVDRGLLLSGPQGVGKTIFAKALAKTCGVNFVSTSVVQWQAKGHLGDLLKAMKVDFEAATKNAPSILFLDELDSIGDRNSFTGDYIEYHIQVVNALLERLDGTTERDGVVVIGATNHPDRIDPAVRRSGRLDKHVVIGLPGERDRLAILGQQLGGALKFSIEELGPRTEGMSGADLAQMVRDAKRYARRAGRELMLSDLTAGLPQMIRVAGEYRRSVAIHEAGHMVVGTRLARGKFVGGFLSSQLNPRIGVQSAGGAAFEVPALLLRNERRYRDDICVLLAGMAAEIVITGSHGDGAGVGPGSDLALATDLALTMETKVAMGGRLSQLGSGTGWDAFGTQQVPWLLERVDAILAEEMLRATEILTAERSLVMRLVTELENTGMVTPKRFVELLTEPTQAPRVRKSRSHKTSSTSSDGRVSRNPSKEPRS